jgi:hypothetical protein
MNSIKAHILLVDCEERWRQHVEDILYDEFEISQAQNYDDAKQKLDDAVEPFDLVITEIHLDEGQQDEAGFALFEYLNTLDVYTRVIFLTYYGDVDFAVRATERHIKIIEKKKLDRTRPDSFDFVKIITDSLEAISVYVFMPFSSRYKKFYDEHVKRIVNKAGHKCERADDNFNPGDIYEKVLSGIRRSSIILADVSEGRPDVYFEAGLAQGLYRSVIVLSRDDKYVPSRIMGREWLPYDPREIRLLEEKLIKAINDTRNEKKAGRLKKIDDVIEIPLRCLVISPQTIFGSDMQQKIILPATGKRNLKFLSTSQIYATTNYIQQVWLELHRSQIIVADLGHKDANVLYLTGLAFALKKKIVLLAKEDSDIPYCLKSSNPITYTGVEEMRQQEIHNLILAIDYYLPYAISMSKHDEQGCVQNINQGAPMETLSKVKVFLNHATEDKPLVRKLYSELKKHPWIDPWIDEDRLLPGQELELEIDKAMKEADAVLVCISSTSVKKTGYVQAEIRKAEEQQKLRPHGVIYMIPVLLESCKDQVPLNLQKLLWVDISDPGKIDSIIKSLETLRK